MGCFENGHSTADVYCSSSTRAAILKLKMYRAQMVDFSFSLGEYTNTCIRRSHRTVYVCVRCRIRAHVCVNKVNGFSYG